MKERLCVNTLLASLFCGSIYVFGVLCLDLQRACELTTLDLEYVYSSGTIGQYVSLIPGALFDRKGCFACLYFGILSSIIGSSIIFVVTYLKCHFITLLCFGFFTLSQGSAAIFQAGMFSTLKLFPSDKQPKLSGLLTAGYGLSGVFLSFVYQFIHFDHKISVFYGALGCALLIQALFMHSTLSSHPIHLGSPPPATENINVELTSIRVVSKTSSNHNIRRKRQDFPANQCSNSSCCPTTFDLKEFVLYAITVCLIQSVCVSTIGNIPLFVTSFNLPMHLVARYVTLVSVFSFFGRIGFAAVSAISTLNLLIYLIISSVALLLLQILYFRLPLVVHLTTIGCIMGLNFALTPAFISQKFGTKHIAFLQASITSSIALVSSTLSWLFGKFYTDEAKNNLGQILKQQQQQTEYIPLICNGRQCTSYLNSVSSTLALFSTLLSLYQISQRTGGYRAIAVTSDEQ